MAQHTPIPKLGQLEKHITEHKITIPINERTGALCLRVHLCTITVNAKDKWNVSNSGGAFIFEKEGEGLKDYIVGMQGILEAILNLRQAIAKAEGE